MRTRGFDKPLYIQPFDHRGSFETGMFGWKGTLTPSQTAQIAATKQVIYDGFKAAIAAGAPNEKAGRTRCSRRCAAGSADTWRKSPASSQTKRGDLR